MAAACRTAPKWAGVAVMMMVIVGATGLLGHWWQGVAGADAKPLAASRTAPTETAQAQAPAARTIPVVRQQVQTVCESLEISGYAAALNQV